MPPATDAGQDDDDLKTQQQMVAELKYLRAQLKAVTDERDSLKGELRVQARMYQVEVERGDFFKTAALTGVQMDKNSQRIDNNGQQAVQILQAQISDYSQRLTALTDNLNSCRSNQKWIAGISAFGGGILGYKLRGVQQTLLPSGLTLSSIFTTPTPASTLQLTPPGLRLMDALTAQQIIERARRQQAGR